MTSLLALAPLALVSLVLVLALVITSRRHARAFAPLSRRSSRPLARIVDALAREHVATLALVPPSLLALAFDVYALARIVASA